MEIVTGDRYLDMLARFVEENIAALLDGATVLKLNPLGLHYLQARLDSLLELERLRISAPVDYLRAYIADLGDHRALELLRRVLRLVGVVKVVSVLQSPARDPTPINLLPFEHLRSLELRGCDLSTSAARGLLRLRPQLERLVCHNSTDALRHVFAERMVDVRGSQVWSRLTSVSCACNGVPVMDESLQLLPEVEVLDLRRNRLTYVTNLERCGRLKYLDLGFNRIQSVSRLQQVASSLAVLVLRFNALATTRGIETLYLLRSLDLSHNIISNFHEVEKFESLRFLVCLNLESNPVTFAGDYRERVFSVFLEPAKVCLDGRYLSRIENWKVQKLIVKRSKRDGAVGLYSPAVKPSCDGRPKSDDDFEEEFTKAKKKSTRLAIIADDDGKSKRVSPVVSATEETSLLNNVEEVETRLQHFMERVEVLKKDKPTFWLSEVSSLFESNADSGSQEQSSESTSERRQKIKSARKSSRKRGSWGNAGISELLSAEAREKTNVLQMNPIDIISSNPVLNQLIDKTASSSSPRSPPQFNREVLQRRQNLEEELMQATVHSEATNSDSSTSTSDDEFENSTRVLDSSDSGSGEPGASKSLLVEEDSCFSNPMWTGSSLDVGKDEESKKDEAESRGNNPQGSEHEKIRKSRQAWRVVPLDYEAEATLKQDV